MTRISRLMAVVLHVGRSRLDAFVQDNLGVYREVRVSWKSLLPTDVPPVNWLDMVEQEVGIQQAEAQQLKRGRVLF